MIDYSQPDVKTAAQARADAQRIAFGPIVFQAVMAMRQLGILEKLHSAGEAGRSVAAIAQALALPEYGVRVLLESGLSSGVVRLVADRYVLTKTGYFLIKDELTSVNMNFVADVCYDAMRHLGDSVVAGKPKGLAVFGPWKTIYEGLAQLPKAAQDSWFAFDHFYSDAAFPEAFPIVFARPVARLLDVGGNTGKWALYCAANDPCVEVTILDLPGQLEQARRHIDAAGMTQRIRVQPMNVLTGPEPWPAGVDVVWMSQFLDCFSAEEIVHLLRNARAALLETGALYILETYWDRQRYEAATFALHNTSLYFTCLANGNSKMYHSQEMQALIAQAGLSVVREINDLGIGHTLLECRRASPS